MRIGLCRSGAGEVVGHPTLQLQHGISNRLLSSGPAKTGSTAPNSDQGQRHPHSNQLHAFLIFCKEHTYFTFTITFAVIYSPANCPLAFGIRYPQRKSYGLQELILLHIIAKVEVYCQNVGSNKSLSCLHYVPCRGKNAWFFSTATFAKSWSLTNILAKSCVLALDHSQCKVIAPPAHKETRQDARPGHQLSCARPM
jgi:hypothetical protein